MQREDEREDLVGIITAARQVGTALPLAEDIRAQALEAISEYLLDIGDNDVSGDLLISAGFALQYVYPADVQISMADYLIRKSNERTQERPFSPRSEER